MMKFLLSLVLISGGAFAQSDTEEAIILNQELQFLENSARDIRLEPKISDTEETEKASVESSLERTYFSDAERDEIRTRAAAPKRRSF
jgi:hypothetical protein